MFNSLFFFQTNLGSRATSIKAEPGSALESNLESNASITTLQAEKMISPGFIGTSNSEDLHEQIINLTDSSMCSLLKSSDNDFTTSDADEDEKDCAPPRPTLPDPFWLTAVDFTPQVCLFCFLLSLDF